VALEDIGVKATIEGLAEYKRGIADMESSVDSFGAAVERNARSFKIAGVALSAFAAGGILLTKKLTSAYLEQRNALQTLAVAVNITGVAFESVQAEVIATTAALQRKTNYADDAQIRALQELVFLSGSYKNSIAALPAVLDLATALNIDLSAATNLVGRGLAGNTALFARYGLQVKSNITPMELITMLTQKFGGAAAANVSPMTQFGNAVNDMQESLGKALLPALTQVLNVLTKLADWVGNLDPTLLKIAGTAFIVATAFAAIAGPILLFLGFLPQMMIGLSMVIGAFSTLKTLLTGPIGLAEVAAALAVGAASVYAVRKFGSFQTGGVMGGSGMALVGERGPEMVRLPAAAQITPMSRTTNYNVTANYANSQQPQGIRLDLEALAMMARR